MPATVCLTFDNMGRAADVGKGTASGPDEAEPGLAVGYPRILDLLDRHGITTTFFIEGWNGIHHPDRLRDLVARGHEVGLHGWVHEPWSGLERAEATELLDRGLAAFAEAGVSATGFRAPGGDRGPHLAALLAERGFAYDASLGTDRVPRRLTEGIAHVPYRWGQVDGAHYLADPPADPSEVIDRWWKTIDAAAAGDEPEVVVLICHAHITGAVAERFEALAGLVERLVGDERIELAPVGTVAARVP